MQNTNVALDAWMAVAALVVLGIIIMVLREIPAMRREMRILRM